MNHGRGFTILASRYLTSNIELTTAARVQSTTHEDHDTKRLNRLVLTGISYR